MRGEISMSDIMGAGYGQPVKKHLDGCNFRFYEGFKKDKEKSDKAGYPQHVSVDFIEIIPPMGDRTVREVQERDKIAYPEQWANYQNNKAEPKDGSWLKAWPLIDLASLADLEAYGLKTVEEVAALDAETCQKVGFLKPLQRLAEHWVNSAKSTKAQVTQLKKKLDEVNAEYESLKDQYTQALRRIEANEGTRLL